MLQDRYGNTLSTASTAARDAYVEGVDRILASWEGAETCFEAAIALDPNFALAHMALARHHQLWGNQAEISAARDAAMACTGVSASEAAHLGAFNLLLSGKPREGYAAIRAHLLDQPRDALAASTCTGVFSLIGFSGQPGREAELLAFTCALAPAYGDDWWFNAQHAFSQMEAGCTGPAAATIERAIDGNPRNANAAHIRSHLYYEHGETEAGFRYLRDWMSDYERTGLLHCHLSWHVALWALEQGALDLMWAQMDDAIAPGTTVSPALNVLTDSASLLYRAERRGVDVPKDRWAALSRYASEYFPKTGIAFADAHAALIYAMAGDGDRLGQIIAAARGPAGDVVRELAEGFEAIAAQDWPRAEMHLSAVMRDHARLGGSRAQRDLVEFAWVSVLMRQGRGDEARRMLAIRRPVATHAGSVVH